MNYLISKTLLRMMRIRVKRVALDTLIYLKNQLLIAEKFEISDPSIERQIIF